MKIIKDPFYLVFGLFCVVCLALSPILELAHDEAYYWMFSKKIAWGYFDHPPLVAWLIKSTGFIDSEFWVRLPFYLLNFASAFLLAKQCSSKIMGLFLFCTFPLLGFGTLALPDGPLVFFTICFLVALRNYLLLDSLKYSLILSLIIPLLLYSKFHGGFLILGAIIFCPEVLKRKSFYMITLISLLLFAPYIVWQFENDFITFQYHLFERPTADFSLKRIGDFLLMAIFITGGLWGPLYFYQLLKERVKNKFERYLKGTIFLTLGFFFISSFSKRIEANWLMFLSPLFFLLIKDQIKNHKFLFISGALLQALRFAILTGEVPIQRMSEFQGWKKFADKAENACQGYPILANSYQIASKLSFYSPKKVAALNLKSRRNQFDLWDWSEWYLDEKVCYLTDIQVPGNNDLTTPEGKKLFIISDRGIKDWISLKNAKSQEI